MRGNQYSDARGPIWHCLRALAGVTMACVTTVVLIWGLPLGGFGITAFDLTIGALCLGRRMGLVRAALCTLGLCILAIALMPPVLGCVTTAKRPSGLTATWCTAPATSMRRTTVPSAVEITDTVLTTD